MDWLVWVGAGVSLVGLAGLVWCILTVLRARRAQLPDDEMRATLARVVPWNMGALLFSVLGLIMVVLGILLS